MRYRSAIFLALLSVAIVGIVTEGQDGAAAAPAAIPSVTGSKVIVVGDMVPDPATGVSLSHARNVAGRAVAEKPAALGWPATSNTSMAS